MAFTLADGIAYVQAALDAAVEAAYGKPADQEATEFLLEMNLVPEDRLTQYLALASGLPGVNAGEDAFVCGELRGA